MYRNRCVHLTPLSWGALPPKPLQCAPPPAHTPPQRRDRHGHVAVAPPVRRPPVHRVWVWQLHQVDLRRARPHKRAGEGERRVAEVRVVGHAEEARVPGEGQRPLQ